MEITEELRGTVHHLCFMLRTVKRLSRGTLRAEVAAALDEHLRALTPADLGFNAPSEASAEIAAPVSARQSA